MGDIQTNSYAKELMDLALSLNKEIANLQAAYESIYQKTQAMTTLNGKAMSDPIKETIDARELARLSLVSSRIACKAALVVGDNALIDATQATLTAADNAHKLAISSVIINVNRQADGEAIKTK